VRLEAPRDGIACGDGNPPYKVGLRGSEACHSGGRVSATLLMTSTTSIPTMVGELQNASWRKRALGRDGASPLRRRQYAGCDPINERGSERLLSTNQ
jgi:hypothetical protein